VVTINSARATHGRIFPRVDGWLLLGLAAICLAQFLALLDGLIVSVALPAMSADLGLTPAAAQWALNAYAVPFAGLLLLGGRLGDALGRRRAFTVGQALLIIGSLVGGLAGAAAEVYLARLLQAGGAALAMPAAVAMLASTFPDESERARAFSLLTVGGGIGWVSAGLFGGLLTQYLGWHSVFLVTIPISALAIVLGRLGLPDHPANEPNSPSVPAVPGTDWPGAVLVVGALGTLVFTLSGVEQVGWWSVTTVVGIAAGLVLSVALVIREQRSANPVLRLSMLSRPMLRGSTLLGMVLPVGFVGSQFLGSLYLQDVLGYGAGRAGLAFVPLALMPLLVTPLVAQLQSRLQSGLTIAIGFALTAAGLGLLAASGADLGYPLGILPGFVLIGIGVTLVYVPLAVTSVADVPERDYGVASALFSTSNQIGGALALAVLTSVIAATVGDTTLGASSSGDQLTGLRAAFGTAAGLCLLGALAAGPLLHRRRSASNESSFVS
jgi:EmrB/QacA subfamily drug resistance transporter